MINPLISKEGFNYFLSLVDSHHISKNSLEQVISSLAEKSPDQLEDTKLSNSSTHKFIRSARKRNQIIGLIRIISELTKSKEYKKVLDVGSGSGQVTAELARAFPQSKTVGIEINNTLVTTARKNYGSLGNLSFYEGNCFDRLPLKPNLIVSLHGCGSITDRVLDLAIESSADVICVPCCYAKIIGNVPGNYIEKLKLPRSKTLSQVKEIFTERVMERVKYLEGYLGDGKTTRARIVRDIYRMLLNYDRLFCLIEQGYQAKVTYLTQRELKINGKKHLNSSLRTVIIGQK